VFDTIAAGFNHVKEERNKKRLFVKPTSYRLLILMKVFEERVLPVTLRSAYNLMTLPMDRCIFYNP
jgi:hypothetical protein